MSAATSMIERASEFGGMSAAVPLTAGDTSLMSAGDMLREAREAHGLHLEVVAAALKVTPQKLAALEADDIGALPDPVFARALAASVCRALRIDPAPVLAKLPEAHPAGLADADRTISRSLRSAARTGGAGRRPSRALLVVVVVLLAGAAALFWLPQSVFDRLGAAAGPGAADDVSAEVAATEVISVPAADEASPPGGAVHTVPSAGQLPETAAPPPPSGTSTPPSLTPPTVMPTVTAPESSTAPASSEALVFVAREASWIAVTDAGGRPLLRRTVEAGETVRLSDAPPLSVVVGRATGVEVQVRGKPLDLAPLTRAGGVARFEIKP